VNNAALARMTKADLLIFIESLNRRMQEMEIVKSDFEQRLDRLLEKNDVYRTLLDESSDPIFMFYPDGTYRFANRAFAEGVDRPLDEIIGHKIWDVFPADEAEKRFTVVKWVFEHGLTRIIEVRVPRKNGDRYYITTVKPILDEKGRALSVICISKDITDRKHIEFELRHLSTHDSLTSLYNRHFFHTEMERLTESRQHPICIVMIDLDNLKTVNDTRGHQAGDLYLQKAAGLLKEIFRSEDILARIGGDEFAVLLPQTDQASLLSILERLKAGIRQYQDDPLFDLSCGWALGEPGTTLDDVMQQADTRMYAEKSLHKKV